MGTTFTDVNGTIYDFPALPQLARASFRRVPAYARGGEPAGPVRRLQVGMIRNLRSHRNQQGNPMTSRRDDVIGVTPNTRAELVEALAGFAARGIDLIAIDGGDGTIRDVMTCGGPIWGAAWPRFLLLPTGKTNALAGDLGVPRRWTLDAALAAARLGRIERRAPIEIAAADGSGLTMRGFIFGTGGFVLATELAQRTHSIGAFNGLAVGLSVLGGAVQALAGGADNRWRRGSRVGLRFADGAVRQPGATLASDGDRAMILASTLDTLPLGMRPFGKPRSGLKTLVIDAPATRLAIALPYLIAGGGSEQLERRGYHRVDADTIEFDLDSTFILDGEIFPGGRYVMRKGAPLRFIVP